MCLLALAIDPNPRYRLVLVANRDEYHARPTLPLHEWTAPADIVAGRDQLGGGTWLGVSRQGRIAALTNYREAAAPPDDPPSRGELVTRFLEGEPELSTWERAIAFPVSQYAGFSLIAGSVAKGFGCLSNRYEPMPLGPGVHGLSNGVINNDWPKVAELRRDLCAALESDSAMESESLYDLLEVRQPAPDERLPDTGVGLETERLLSSRFILGADYGTRSATIVTVEPTGLCTLMERRYAPDGTVLGTTRTTLSID